MKVLFVYSGNKKISPFMLEQAESLKKIGVFIRYFPIKGHGIFGYLKNYFRFLRNLNKENINLIHAHYGLSGLFSNLQFKIPVITTYHGSDINKIEHRIFSFFSIFLSRVNIYVSKSLIKFYDKKAIVVPCGIDFSVFYPIEKKNAKIMMGLDVSKKYILFSGAFDNKVKNSNLAIKAIGQIKTMDLTLLELKGYTRKEVNMLLNASELLLMTSFSEGSPQVIKEALACNCPVVSTDVGDVKELIENIEGCYICKSNEYDVAEKIKLVLNNPGKINSRDKISHLDSKIIAQKIVTIYENLIKK